MSTDGNQFVDELSLYAPLWGEQRAQYALLRVKPTASDLLIVDISCGQGEALLIEDDEVFAQVIRNMRSCGVPVVNDDELERMCRCYQTRMD